MHDSRAMAIKIDEPVQGEDLLNLIINGVRFNELLDAPAKEREPLARATTSINMNGKIKRAYFPLLRNGELIPVHVQLNKLTKFAKL